MRYVVTFLGIVLLGSASIVAAQESEVKVKHVPLSWEQAALSDGEALYAELCVACHGRDGTGGGPAVEALAIAVPDLTQMASSHGGEFPADRAEGAIKGDLRIAAHGSRDMPIWGLAFHDLRPDWKPFRREGFAELRVRALVSYLESIQVQPAVE